MIKLIKNEFKKLFSRKLIYVLFIISIGFVILNNVLSAIDFSMLYENNDMLDKEMQYYEQELENMDYKNVEDNTLYIDMKTSLDLIKLQKEYGYDSWQYGYIVENDDIYSTIWEINKNTYGLEKSNEILDEYTKKYEEIKLNLKADNWRALTENKLKEEDENIKFYKTLEENTKDKRDLEEIERQIKQGEISKKCLEWRLEKDISYGNSFLSNTIRIYEDTAKELLSIEKTENMTRDEESSYRESVKTLNTNLYYIENNIQEDPNTRDFMVDGNSIYGSFVTIFSIIVAGTIVSLEFQKGTIKLLLTRPYSRTKILLAKFIVSIISIIIFIILFILAQYIIGGIVFGFDGYKIPAVEYDFSKNAVVTMPSIIYSILIYATNLPMYILLITLAFALSTIFMNSAVGVAIPILGNSVAGIFVLFVEKIKILKYFVTLNWDFSVYLFGGMGLADGLTPIKSGIICIIYFLIMIILCTVIFQKRDIKNV